MPRIWRCVSATIGERGIERLQNYQPNLRKDILNFLSKRKRRMRRRASRGITLLIIFLLVGLLIPNDLPIRIEEIPQLIHKTKATKYEKANNKKLAIRYAEVGFGYGRRERVCLTKLWGREASFNHLAKNPKSTAFGISQLLGETSRDPAIQILRGLRYIQYRYDNSACSALRFHNRNGWY